MIYRRVAGYFFLLLFSLLGFSSQAFSLEKSEATVHMHDSYLIIQSAEGGTIQQNNDNSNTYTLTLTGVNPYISYFTDRPDRKAGVMLLEKFMNRWVSEDKNSFKKNPPNAYFHAMETNNNAAAPQNYSVELTNPKYNASDKTLTYTVKLLAGNLAASLPSPTKVEHVILFIDDACLSCW